MGGLTVRRTTFACCALLALAAPAAAQLRLPPQDGRGYPLAPPEAVQTALHDQQVVIYVLALLLLVSLLVNVWTSVLYVRLQHTVERITEAVRRVDVLSYAFHSAQRHWDRAVEATLADHGDDAAEAVVDLDSSHALPRPARKEARSRA